MENKTEGASQAGEPAGAGNLGRLRLGWILPTTLAVLCLASGILLALLIMRRQNAERTGVEKAREAAIAVTREAAARISEITLAARKEADFLAGRLSRGDLDGETAPNVMRELIESNPSFYGGTITYRPYGHAPGVRLHAPYCMHQDGSVICKPLEDDYDYTAAGTDWYLLPMKNGPQWVEPYRCGSGNAYMATYSAPFFAPGEPQGTDRKPLGVVTIDITVDELERVSRSLDFGRGGFAALTSREGRYFYHPNTDLVTGRKTLLQVAEELNDPDRVLVAGLAERGETGVLLHTSTTTGRKSWLVVEPVPDTGWSVQGTYLLTELLSNVVAARRMSLDVVIAAVAFGILLAGTLFAVRPGRHRIWLLSTIISLLLAAGIGLTWHHYMEFHPTTAHIGTPVTGVTELAGAKQDVLASARDKGIPEPQFLPVGVFVQSAEFVAANNVQVTGYVWERLAPGHKPVDLLFPEATDMEMQESYSRTTDESTVIGWRFRGTLRERFEYKEFPLDRETIWLRVRAASPIDPVVLVPDLDSYPIHAPVSRPGLASDLVLPGWDAISSFFSLKSIAYTTNFGLKNAGMQGDYPELFFCMAIQRRFNDAFISYLTPLLVVTMMLFGMLLALTRHPERFSLLGPQTSTVLGFTAALFFVVIFSHIDLRQKLSAQSVFYLEYFYLIMYVAILLVSIISLVFMLDDRIKVVQYRDCLLPKVTYFPFLLLSFFVVTIATFY